MWASTSVYSRSRLGFGRSNSATYWQHVRNDELMPTRECLLLMPRSDDRGWTAMICTNLKLFDLFQSSCCRSDHGSGTFCMVSAVLFYFDGFNSVSKKSNYALQSWTMHFWDIWAQGYAYFTWFESVRPVILLFLRRDIHSVRMNTTNKRPQGQELVIIERSAISTLGSTRFMI